jgi:hypothetical protein
MQFLLLLIEPQTRAQWQFGGWTNHCDLESIFSQYAPIEPQTWVPWEFGRWTVEGWAIKCCMLLIVGVMEEESGYLHRR